MIKTSDAFNDAFASPGRELRARVTIGKNVYDSNDLTSISYDSGAMTGEQFSIGSTYMNSTKITFSHLIEGLKQLDEVLVEFGIVKADGSTEYVKMGTFIVDEKIQMDRNNNSTTIECMDRMVMLGGIYKSKLTYPADIQEVAVEIANMSGVKTNETSLARLPKQKINEPIGYSYRDAIGLIAQFAIGFALFDRNGFLDIRSLVDNEFKIDPNQYFLKGLVKNETFFKLNGISCTVVTTSKDENGNETSKTTVLQSGSASGSQIKLANNVMTQDILDQMYETIKHTNYFPFTLNWNGNPAVEAGDWLTLEDIQGNEFKVPNMSYTLTYNGGLTASSKAETSTNSSVTYSYGGSISNSVVEIGGREGAEGNHIYEGTEDDEPLYPKEGDLWYKHVGPDTEEWIYSDGEWKFITSTKTTNDIAKAVNDAVSQAKSHVEEVKRVLGNDIETAKSKAVEAANAAQQNAIDVASKSLGTYLVRLLPGTNIFKTTNSTTIQAQVWKTGQDITSTLDNASFSWKIAKDGAAAISLTSNVKSVTANPSDFANTGTYTVNVIIPVTDTTGTTRNQTFSDSVTIAKVADGVDSTDGKNGAAGNGISSTTITYAVSASGTNAPTSGYTSTIPTVNKGQFLWQRTTTSYTNGTTKNSDVVTYFAKDGLNGVDGMDGGQGMIAQPSKPTSGLVDGFLWLDTSQTYPVYYIYDSSIKDFKIYQFNAKNINADQIKAKFVGTGRLSASEIIADDLHVKSANIDGKMTASQITVSSTNGTQTSLANFNLGEISQTISDTKNAVNKLNQNNLVNNSQLNPDYSGWHITSPWGKSVTTELWNNGVESKTGAMWVWHDQSKSGEWIYSDPVAVLPGISLSASVTAAMPNPPSSRTPLALYVYTYDANKTRIDSFGLNINYNMVNSTFKKFNLDNKIVSSGAKYASVVLGWNEGGQISFGKPMLMFGTTTGDYVAGPYNNNDKIASQQITIDGINNFVRDSSGNISSSFQTALSKTSLITGSTLASSIQKQTSSQISSALTDNNGKIISLINQDTSGVQISGKNIVLDGNTTFTNLQNNVNSLGQVNLINNSNFLPDYSGWHVNSPWGNNVTNEVWNNGVNNKGAMWIWHDKSKSSSWLSSEAIPVSSGMTFSAAVWAAMPTVPSSGVPLAIYITFYDVNQKELSSAGYNIPLSSLNGAFNKFSLENISTPSGAKYVALRFAWSVAGSISFGQPMLVMSSSVGDYVAGSYNNNAALTQVKNTADGISNFVRDSSGNISSDFQTALSKTSIITGSTLATSIQTQTSSQISSAITDNNGKIISLINQDSSGVQIAGKNIVLDGNTTVTGDFYAKGGNFKNLNASEIKTGTINAANVNLINMNASNITTGTIKGASLSINLLNGNVTFQKGRIYSTTGTIDMNIDQGYLSVTNASGTNKNNVLIKDGEIAFTQPGLFDPSKDPYLRITNSVVESSFGSSTIQARGALEMNIKGHESSIVHLGQEKFAGIKFGFGNSNKLEPTYIGGANVGVTISGGTTTDYTVNMSPYIQVGTDGINPNNEIHIYSEWIRLTAAFNQTTSSGSNVYIKEDGTLMRSTSASKYKQNIIRNVDLSDSEKLLNIPLARWDDKAEVRRTGTSKRYFGMIAEDLAAAGLEYLVDRGPNGEIEGIEYSKVALLLIPEVKKLRNKIEMLEQQNGGNIT